MSDPDPPTAPMPAVGGGSASGGAPGSGPGGPGRGAEPGGPGWPAGPGRPGDGHRWRTAAIAVGAVVALLAALLAVALLRGGRDEAVTVGTSTTELAATTTAAVTSTTVAPTTTTAAATTAPPPTVPAGAPVLWPAPGQRGLTTPEEAALDFARRFAGMRAPTVAGSRTTGTSSAEVDIRARPTAGRVTTVFAVRAGGLWAVERARGQTIAIDQPPPGAEVGSPLTVNGRCDTNEGTVLVEVRRQGATTAIASRVATGAQGQMRPYTATLEFQAPAGTLGALVVLEPRADDESAGPLQVTAQVLRF